MTAPPDKHLMKMPLRDYFERVYRKQLPKSIDRGTISRYRRSVDRLLHWAGRELTVGEVTASMLYEYRRWLHESGRVSDKGRTGPLSGTPKLHPRVAQLMWWNVRAVVGFANPGICRRITSKEIDASLRQAGSVAEFFETEYLPKRMLGCRPGSVHQMRLTIRLFAEFMGRVPMLADLNTDAVTGFVAYMLEAGRSRPTINSRRGNLCSLWKYAYKRKLLPHPPDIDKLKEYRRLPVAWTLEEFGRIIAASRQAKGCIGRIPARDWWPALLMFLYDTGLRVSAALAVEWDAFDPTTGWVTVEAEVQKQKVEQNFHLSEQTLEFIMAIRGDRRERLFAFTLCPTELQDRYTAILKSAGLPHSRKHKFHMIRRTTATQLAKVASPDVAAKHLGHSTVDVTKRYIDPRQIASHDVAALLPRVNTGDATEGSR